jgi:hypothetical protein
MCKVNITVFYYLKKRKEIETHQKHGRRRRRPPLRQLGHCELTAIARRQESKR